MVKRVLIVIISWMHTVYFEQVCPLYYTLLTPLSPPLFFKQYLLSFIILSSFIIVCVCVCVCIVALFSPLHPSPFSSYGSLPTVSAFNIYVALL
jgi:hypothetical protein